LSLPVELADYREDGAGNNDQQGHHGKDNKRQLPRVDEANDHASDESGQVM
jgi:hypothetical protein